MHRHRYVRGTHITDKQKRHTQMQKVTHREKYTQIDIHRGTHKYIHIYTHTHMHAHTHTYTHLCSVLIFRDTSASHSMVLSLPTGPLNQTTVSVSPSFLLLYHPACLGASLALETRESCGTPVPPSILDWTICLIPKTKSPCVFVSLWCQQIIVVG